MLTWSAWLLTGVVLLGLVLVAMSQVMLPGRRPWWPGALHGVGGLAAFVLLLLGLEAPARGVQDGAGSFGLVAAGLLAAALALGGWIAAGHLRRRSPAMVVVGVHATFGVAALVMLAAYLAA